MKKLVKFLFSRMVIIGALIALQVALLVATILLLSNSYVYVYAAFCLLSLVMVIWVINKNENPSFKLPWIVVMILMPIFGGLFYMIFGKSKLPKKTSERLRELTDITRQYTARVTSMEPEIEKENPYAAMQCRYIQNSIGMPVYKKTRVEYLTPGEVKFERMKKELEKAEHFIFLEYFIIQEGIMWNSILEILVKKAKQGLDVRVLYDDVGCLQTIPHGYNLELEQLGIKCVVFNPFRPALATVLHNRDHRKICIIDGHTCFTGGINLADEYINAYQKHGHWKDASVVLYGEAVWSFTLMFLETWNLYRAEDTDYTMYMPQVYAPTSFEDDGYVQPYGDSPLDEEYVSEYTYIGLINSAIDYIYINTPYFIVDNELITAITMAAKRGVDIRIVMPHIADKWYVHMVTQSFYKQLISVGVKVYEYTPGFIHSKTFVVDDKISIVGTINLDYRSLYHHYECGLWMYKTKCVMKVKDDFLKTLRKCQIVTLEECDNVSWVKRIIRSLLKLLAPLM